MQVYLKLSDVTLLINHQYEPNNFNKHAQFEDSWCLSDIEKMIKKMKKMKK